MFRGLPNRIFIDVQLLSKVQRVNVITMQPCQRGTHHLFAVLLTDQEFVTLSFISRTSHASSIWIFAGYLVP